MKPEINNNIISKDKLKDVLVTKTAIKTLQKVSVVDKVISHSFKLASVALKSHRDVEMSGFGIFKTNDFRAKQLLEKKQKQIDIIENKIATKEMSESAISNYKKTIDRLKVDINCINSKLLKPDEN